MGVVSRVGCLSLLLTMSLSIELHFEPSCAVVSHIVSLVRSLSLVESGEMSVCVEVVCPSLGQSSVLPAPVLLG